MVRLRTLALAALLVAGASPARADITAFIGANTTPANRAVKGFAVGASMLVIGFEFEYASAGEDLASQSPSLKTGSGNILLQTPGAVFGFQPYFTMGGGIYHEALGSHGDTSFALNTGGGVKISLVGPVRVRVDYRAFKLGSGALHSPAHRIYLGLNLTF